MTAPDSDHPDAAHGPGSGPGDQPVATLRGATVDVDVRRAGQVVVAVCLLALAVTGTILLIAGIRNNDQIDNLRHNGVPVTLTVDRCLGLMGGTGAQVAGYSCTATYTVDGVVYHQAIPGLSFHSPGSIVSGVAVPGDPKLLSTPDQLARQHASWRVFVVPGALLLVVVVVLAALGLRRSGRAHGLILMDSLRSGRGSLRYVH